MTADTAEVLDRVREMGRFFMVFIPIVLVVGVAAAACLGGALANPISQIAASGVYNVGSLARTAAAC